MVQVVLRAVRVDVGSATPLLLLEEVNGPRVLPVYIGAQEATAIAYALQGIEAPRPMTHDLLDNVIEALGAQLFAVEVTELVQNTYFAALRLVTKGDEIVVSSRPSDAIALALRAGAPILVNDDLMASEGKIIDLDDDDESTEVVIEDDLELSNDEEPRSESELVEELRAFLDNVNPEDFGQ
jgi:bifunctional DNase/RNase